MNIDDEINEYCSNKVSILSLNWERLIITYVSAYNKAFKNYQNTLEKEKEYQETVITFTITALSICSGSVLIALLGGLTAKEALTKFATKIAKSFRKKAYRDANLKKHDKIIEFITGSVYDELNTKIKDNAFQDTISFIRNIQNDINYPFDVFLILNRFLIDCEWIFRETLENIKNLKDNEKKKKLFTLLKESHYCFPPSTQLYKADLNLYIELSFYMILIMNTDHLVTEKYSMGKKVYYKSDSINESVNSKKYPKTTCSSTYTGAITSRISYDRIGQDIIDRINEVYKTLFHKKFIDSDYFGEHTNAKILFKAEDTLKRINLIVNNPFLFQK